MEQNRITLSIPQLHYDQLLRHLLREGACEEAAFVFCNCSQDDGSTQFQFIEWLPVSPDGFVARSPYYLELTDETRARVIKRAHDLGASLIEFHSHRSIYPAAFSPSDFSGFEEFVPHVWWRLQERPYAAVMVAETSFDAIAWMADPRQPETLAAIAAGSQVLIPTGRSLGGLRDAG